MATAKKKTTTTKKKTTKKVAETAPIAAMAPAEEAPSSAENTSAVAKATEELQRTLADFVTGVLPDMMQADEWEKVPAMKKWDIVKDCLPYILARMQPVEATSVDDTAGSQLKQLAASIKKQ